MGSAQSGDSDGPILGINVTPLVDVTLVLLIVFMITAKMIVQQGIPLELPRTASATKIESTLTLTIDAQGAMSIDGRPVADGAALTQAAKEAHARASDTKAVIRAPSLVMYGSVIGAMDALRRGDVTHIALATEKSAAPSSAR